MNLEREPQAGHATPRWLQRSRPVSPHLEMRRPAQALGFYVGLMRRLKLLHTRTVIRPGSEEPMSRDAYRRLIRMSMDRERGR